MGKILIKRHGAIWDETGESTGMYYFNDDENTFIKYHDSDIYDIVERVDEDTCYISKREDTTSIETNKYEMHVCKCGHIHLIPNEKIEKALEEDKNFMLICADCGTATIIGASIEPDYDDPSKKCYMMYSGDVDLDKGKTSLSISEITFKGDNMSKPVSEIFYNHGVKVPMLTGNYATDYFGDLFSDRWYPDLYKIESANTTMDDVRNFLAEYRHDRQTVHMARFISETPDEYLDYISRFHFKSFNWKGTKWETEWNSID